MEEQYVSNLAVNGAENYRGGFGGVKPAFGGGGVYGVGSSPYGGGGVYGNAIKPAGCTSCQGNQPRYTGGIYGGKNPLGGGCGCGN